MPDLETILNSRIDYAALLKIGTPACVGRLQTALDTKGIKTYRSLVEYAGSHITRDVKENKIRTVFFVGVGDLGLRVLYTHLNDLSIYLFGDAYKGIELIPLGPRA